MIRHDYEVMQLKFSRCYTRTQYFNQQRRIPFRLKDASRHTGLRGDKNTRALLSIASGLPFRAGVAMTGAKALIRPNHCGTAEAVP